MRPAAAGRGSERNTMVLDKLASVGDGRRVRRLRDISQLVNTFEPEFEEIPTEELPAKSEELRRRLADGESSDDVLPEAFAVVREASKRTLGQRHYDVQVIGAAVLHQGDIA